MSIRVYTGLPATGKTSSMIQEMKERREGGGKVLLFLSAENPELTRRPNVKPGGLMGSRVPGVRFPIDHVVKTKVAGEILESLDPGVLAVFDEAQYFSADIVDHWLEASQRGIDILVATPSVSQERRFAPIEYEQVHFEVTCVGCNKLRATRVLFERDLVYPLHLCSDCHEVRMNLEIDTLLNDVQAAKPFPGQRHTYQPFYNVDMSGWGLVRGDSPQRFDIIMDAVERCHAVYSQLEDLATQPSFIDFGCCSGFFSDAMASQGFRASGVDVDKNFIDWAGRLARIKGQAINYVQSDLVKYLSSLGTEYDVTSTFATVQWVMDQKGYQAGMECFAKIFEKTRHIAVVEMGYTTEDIYSDKITDRPIDIDRDWVYKMMTELGDFATIELHKAGEKGIWRDIFVGFKEVPTPRPFLETIKADRVAQLSDLEGYWPDGWAEDKLGVDLKVMKASTRFHLEGWRPAGSGACNINVSVGDIKSYTATATGGVFSVKRAMRLSPGEAFRLEVVSNKTIDVPDDRRHLAFILRSLKFT